MAKDPAFLFYTSDFLTGVTDLTMEERGQYITILCLQHQKGRLNEKTIRLAVGSVSVDVLAKFEKDENGLFYNKRLEIEIQNRISFTESRRLNGLKGGRPKANAKPYALPNGKPTNNLPENENVNEDINVNVFEKGVIGEKTQFPDDVNISQLTKADILTTQEFLKLTAKTDWSENELSEYFEAFKIQNFTGKKFYEDHSAIIIHFRNWMKSQKKSNINGTTKTGKSAAIIAALKELK